MAIKNGPPRENTSRSLTSKERAALCITNRSLIVSGTRDGFVVYDGNGKVVPISDAARIQLIHYWETPIKYTLSGKIPRESDIRMWLVFDSPLGCEKRYVARCWVHREDKLIVTTKEIQADDLETLRNEFMARGYTIRPKGFGKIIDIWVEPDNESMDYMDRGRAAI